MSVGWARQAIWWHVYPLGFLGAEASSVPATTPRLRQLEPWLDYLVGLGANGLALGPVFASMTHGYDTRDHFAVDSRLGTEADLVHLIEECHRRGIRVQLDGVFNHVGRQFAPFVDVKDKKALSEYAEWFHLDFNQPSADGFGYRSFEGHDSLVALDHRSRGVGEHVAAVMTYWCDRGVDSWRLDAAYAVPPSFWAQVLPQVRAAHPQVWITGEMIHGDYASYVAESGIDSVTQYELWKATWSALNDRNMFELAHAISRHATLLTQFLPQTFIGNHDVTRIATQLDDPRHLALAVAILLTVPGVPSIYYGDERGLRAVKEHRLGGDDAIRPAFPSTPSELDLAGAPVYDLYRSMIAVRRRHPWLADATQLSARPVSNDVLVVQTSTPDRSAALILNVGDVSATVELPMVSADLEAGAGSLVPATGDAVRANVEPHSHMFVVSA